MEQTKMAEWRRTKPVHNEWLLFMFQGASQSAVPFGAMHGHLCVHWCTRFSLRLHAGDKVCVVFKIWWVVMYCEETVVPISATVVFGGSSRLLFKMADTWNVNIWSWDRWGLVAAQSTKRLTVGVELFFFISDNTGVETNTLKLHVL